MLFSGNLVRRRDGRRGIDISTIPRQSTNGVVAAFSGGGGVNAHQPAMTCCVTAWRIPGGAGMNEADGIRRYSVTFGVTCGTAPAHPWRGHFTCLLCNILC